MLFIERKYALIFYHIAAKSANDLPQHVAHTKYWYVYRLNTHMFQLNRQRICLMIECEYLGREGTILKVWIMKKNTLVFTAIVIALCIALAIAVIQLVPHVTTASAQKKELPIYNVDRTDKIASLSFDAAWGAEDTPKLIQILNQYHVHATFFVVGQWVDKYPDAVKALSDAGNEVMNHSDTHPHMPKLSTADMQKQVEACDAKIEKITGKKPTLFRPPYGDYNNAVIQTLRGMNHDVIQWNVDTIDMKVKHPVSYKRRTSRTINESRS